MEEVRNKYIELAKLHHPDVNNQERAKFQEIANAYETLSDSKSRMKYDMSLGTHHKWFVGLKS